ncbi:hypothetical protein [Sphaerisporangium aureirubrum]|uniref:Uncharacterized protein n=1 Tax=Sphaerisporangium aureirubrum TaxID=1544736 RepID=A0ABW1NL62_9ACTN
MNGGGGEAAIRAGFGFAEFDGQSFDAELGGQGVMSIASEAFARVLIVADEVPVSLKA